MGYLRLETSITDRSPEEYDLNRDLSRYNYILGAEIGSMAVRERTGSGRSLETRSDPSAPTEAEPGANGTHRDIEGSERQSNQRNRGKLDRTNGPSNDLTTFEAGSEKDH